MGTNRRSMRSDVVAVRLSAQIDGLARALTAAGAPADASARLLELAAVAALHAVSLAELTGDDREPEPAGTAVPPAASLAAAA
jgi:hypothetical protein